MPGLIANVPADRSEPVLATIKDIVHSALIESRVIPTADLERASDLSISRGCKRYFEQRKGPIRTRDTAHRIYTLEIQPWVNRYVAEHRKSFAGRLLSLPPEDERSWDLATCSTIFDMSEKRERTVPSLFFPRGLRVGDSFFKNDGDPLVKEVEDQMSEFVADWRWIHRQIRNGSISVDVEKYLAIFEKRVVATGTVASEARSRAVDKTGIPPDRVVVVYIGDHDSLV